MKEHMHNFFTDFWFLVVIPLVVWIGKKIIDWMFARIVKSYEDEIKSLRADMNELKKDVELILTKDYLPRKDALEVVTSVQKEHEKMGNQAREDFKHLSNLLVDTNERVDKVYELLVKIVDK